jgi:hypothetical protein
MYSALKASNPNNENIKKYLKEARVKALWAKKFIRID